MATCYDVYSSKLNVITVAAVSNLDCTMSGNSVGIPVGQKSNTPTHGIRHNIMAILSYRVLVHKTLSSGFTIRTT